MTSISDIAALSEEVQKGEVFGIGIVRLYNVNNPFQARSISGSHSFYHLSFLPTFPSTKSG